MSLNNQFSKQLQVKPLKEGETATFKLLVVGKIQNDREEPGGQKARSIPEDVWISGSETVYDRFSGRKFIMRNVTQQMPLIERNGAHKMDADGNPIYGGRPSLVKFKRGFVTVTAEDNDTYIFLMRSNKNIKNKFRSKKVTATFELLSASKDLEDKIQIADMQFRATEMVRNADFITLKAIAEKLNRSPEIRLHVSDMNNFQALKMEIVAKVPTFYKAILVARADPKSLKVVHIYEAMNFSILILGENETEWFLLVKDKLELIYTVPPDKDKIESLVEFFETDEGRSAYQTMAITLKEILSPKAGGPVD